MASSAAASRRQRRFPWNIPWTLTGAWLGVVPTAFLLASPAASFRKEFREARLVILFALTAIAIYLAAVVDLYVRLPVYSTAKATYMLGLLPCFAVLAAVGAAPLCDSAFREFVFSAVAVWAFASYAAYFDVTAIARLLSKAP